ncbi:MAG: hypothetical protein ABEH40_04300 [Haloferacaceae archaeon]
MTDDGGDGGGRPDAGSNEGVDADGTAGIDGAELGRRLRERSPAERRRFVADLWAAGGWETAVEGSVVRVARPEDPPDVRRVLVPEATGGDGTPVDVLLCDPDAGSGGTRLTPADLYRRARYGLDGAAADALFRRHFGRPMAATGPSAGEPAGDDPPARRGATPGDDPGPATDGEADDPDRRRRALARGIGIGIGIAAVAVLVIAAAVGVVPPGASPGAVSPAGPAGSGGDPTLAARYAGLRPTCDRPPGVVVAIQVGALKHNDAGTDAGLRTAWRFTAPTYRRAVGSFAGFVRTMNGDYGPLVNHDRARLGPVERAGSEIGRDEGTEEVRRTVVVRDYGGAASAFAFTLTEEEGGERDGCWLTVSIDDVSLDEVGGAAAARTPDAA